ncbi:NHS-like protein 3 [Aplochiton taeniatus]
MSRRRSLGDLVPKDISEVVAREAKAQRGHRKPGGSLGQAFSWLKGSRRKKSLSNGLGRVGAGTAEGEGSKPDRQNPDPIKAGSKASDEQKQLAVHFTASQLHQENVFIQGSRPQYLEDLHTEAQEGLKIQQQEEHENGVDSQDDQSVNQSISSTLPERDAGSKDGACSAESGSPAGNSASTATSAVSAVSTRPVLTRQGSTFKPLNPVKKFEKNRKRSRRTTILGIPQQVQKELALHRSSTFGASLLPNDGGQAGDRQSGIHQRLGSHRLPSSTDQRPKSLAVPWMTSSVSSTGFGFLQEPLGPVMSISPQATYLSKIIPNAVLPASVDVIQIDRGNSRNRGSIHNHGGNSRTVSKSSLAHSELSASPASSRRSDSDGSHADGSHNTATPMPATASSSSWNQLQSSETIMSQTSTVSFKPCAGTGSPQTVSLAGQGSQRGEPRGEQDLVSLQSSTSCSSTKDARPGSSGQVSESSLSASASAGEMSRGEREGMRTSRSCSRSLSIVKTKLPPAPPRRTNSLHHVEVAKRQSERLVEIQGVNDSSIREVDAGADRSPQREGPSSADVNLSPGPVCDSTVSSTCSSLSPTLIPALDAGGPPKPQPESSSASPHKAPPSEAGKFERTLSPSSGYSSQSGTPTLSPKGIPPTPLSSGKQKKRPVKPERSGSRASSSTASASSSLTSLSSATSEPVHQEALTNSPSPPQHSSPLPVAGAAEKAVPVKQTPSPATIRELLDIPPHPKVKAPSPPPSETWAHNGRTLELLCGLSPNSDRLAQLQKQQQSGGVNTGQNNKAETEDSKPERTVKRDGKPTAKADVVPLPINGRVPLEKSEAILVVRVCQELESPESRSTEPASLSVAEGETATKLQGPGLNMSPLMEELKSHETLPKKETPPVMTKSPPKLNGEEAVTERQQQVKLDGVIMEVRETSPVEIDGPLKKSQGDVAARRHEAENERAAENTPGNPPMETQPPFQALAVDSPTVPKSSPPPSPPPAYHPPPPPARKTPPPSVSSPPPKEEEPTDGENIPPVESCWPPPPPPLQAPVDSVFEGPEDMDFPPPPPPLLTDSQPDVVGGCVSEMDVPCSSAMALEEVAANLKEAAEADITMNRESSELSSLQTQIVVEDITSGATAGSNSKLSNSEREIQDVPPLPQDVPPPPLEAPPPPPVTDAMPLSRSSPTPPSSVPPPPSKQFGDLAPSEPSSSAPPASSINVPSTIPPAENNPTTVSFRRQPSLAGRDARAKELLARQKSAPIPKEDANIPLVTPSLLQMVRLRSVNVGDEPVKSHPEDGQSINGGAATQDPLPTASPSSQNIPQKPIRKSLSLKSLPPTARTPPVTLNAPSMRLQEAIRMKTAAMSSKDGLSSRLSLRSLSANSSVCDPATQSPKSPEGGDIHKSPASTASFIFSRSTKKVVIEAPTSFSPEAQASLKKSLAAELMQASDPSQVSNGTAEKAEAHSFKYPGKVPPPVAKKPGLGTSHPADKMGPDTNGETESMRPAGQTAPLKELQTTTKTVTPGTIETLF